MTQLVGTLPLAQVPYAWIVYNMTGTPTTIASYNATGTLNATGDFTMNITTAAPNANYAITGSCQDSLPYVFVFGINGNRTQTTSAANVVVWRRSDGSLANSPRLTVVIYCAA